MTLTRWSPVSGLAALEVNSLNRMFEAAFGSDVFSHGAWIPPVDILETADGEVVVKAELPDLKREDIKITFENNILTIEGERKSEPTKEADRYHRVERSYGAFRRSFTLPASVDAAKVQASYRDGVLTVTLPRREETRPRQIQVNG
jgi:HSP20 family protein